MKNDSFVDSPRFYRFAEVLTPVLTLILITFPLWLSPFHPAICAYLILSYILYFCFKSFRTMYYAWISYNIFNRSVKIDWMEKLSEDDAYKKINHFALITNYKESVEKVEHTIDCLVNQKFPSKQIHIILAMEDREGESAIARAAALEKKYGSVFGSFSVSYHTMSPGEVVGKASNEAFAARRLYALAQEKKWDPATMIVTILDADSLLPDQYMANVTYKYLADPDREYHFYAAPVLLYNNFWKLPLPVRLQTIVSSVIRLAYLPQEEDFIQISTYSASLAMIHDIGYWDTDIIPEDWHIHLQAFFKYGNKARTIPIYLPVIGDPTLSNGLWKTLKSRYDQEKRWSSGASDVAYAIVQSFKSPHIPLWVRVRKLFFVFETHLLWPSSFFLLTVSGWIPALVNPTFNRTVLGFLLPKIASFMMTGSTFLLLLILYFDHKLRSHVNIKTDLKKVPLLFIQWYFLPVVSFFFSSLPALESHVRLLLGRKIEYQVTEKV